MPSYACREKEETFPIHDFGIPLESTSCIRDLGILLTPDLKFTEHVRAVVAKAARRSNFILRSFILPDPSVYARLFRIYVLPILTLRSLVWNPALERDAALLEAVYDRFRRRAVYKCSTQKSSIEKVTMTDVLLDCDRAMFKRIVNDPELLPKFFDLVVTRSRNLLNYRPKFVAKSNLVNNMFPWRCSRLFR